MRTALITGCSSGIGYATAERLSADGWKVYATARRPETLDGLENCEKLALDVTDEESMKAAVDAVGPVDALVNNAGYSQSGAVESVPIDEIRRQFETNVFGLVRMSQLVLPGMRERRSGRIVNMSSMGGRLTFPGGGVYHSTKYAIEALSDAMRFEVRGFGVHVILVEPGLIVTNFAQTASGSVTTEGPYGSFNRAVAKVTEHAYNGPMSKLGGGPDAVAETVAGALRAKRPKARYRVTPSAHLMIGQRWLVPDRVWDLMMRAQFPTPE